MKFTLVIFSISLSIMFFNQMSFAKEKDKSKQKNFLNDLEYVAINFKINEQYDGIELLRNEFIDREKENKGKNSKVLGNLNAFSHSDKIERLHRNKTYSEFKNKHQRYMKKGKTLPKLENWYSIPITKKMSPNEILDIYNKLLAIPEVSSVELVSPVVSANWEVCPSQNCGDDLPSGGGNNNPTPDLEGFQDYLNASPLGIDARYAWTRNGGDGAGVKIINMENGFNHNHEDLPTPFIRVDDANDADHGTAVLSIVGARDNNVGVTGIAHGGQIGLVGWGGNTAAAIVNAADALDAGDIMILEGQINRNLLAGDTCTQAVQTECVPMEWNQANYDSILYATVGGIVVIEAAGNGNNNLDENIYQGLFNRNVRNSGAFLIAATDPNANIDRSPFSNHGTRIDFNGWGNNVAAAGLFGSTLFNGGPNRTYGDGFAGTSSASPIVAGAVASLQGFSKQSLGSTLDVESIRTILTNTGVPEPAGEEVGVRPNLLLAISSIENVQIPAAPVAASSFFNCFGMNFMSWNSVPGAISYKVFVNGAERYTTTFTYGDASVSSLSSGTVKACNSNICSAYSNAVVLKTTNGCF